MKLATTCLSGIGLSFLLCLLIWSRFSYAESFCRCEDEKDLSYLVFRIDEDWKSFFIDKLSEKNDEQNNDYYSNDCSFCTKINCQAAFNKNENKEALLYDLKVSCFQRESLRDKLIVYGFFLLVFGLLVASLIKRLY